METKNLKILAIDDNRDNLMALNAVVLDRLPGTQVLTALNGPKGLELARAEDPDVILLDIVMPDMDGYSVCRKLKEDEHLQMIPVLFLTAIRADMGSRLKALDAGAEGFLCKPFDEVDLTAQIRAMVKLKAANRIQKLEKEHLAALVAERTSELEKELAERKRAEEALRFSEIRYRRLFESAKDGILLLDAGTGMIVDVNPYLIELLEFSLKDLLGKKIWELGIFKDVIANHDKFLELQQREYVRYEDLPLETATGRRIEVEFVSNVYLVNAAKVIQCNIRNITERKKAETTLREKEFQYRNLANSGLALIWTAGTDKLCNYFNEPWLNFTGRTLQQEQGNGWTEGVHPDDFAQCVKTYVSSFDKREAFDMEYRMRNASGEFRWIRDLGSPNYNSNGDFIGYIGHCFDITDHKRVEMAVRQQAELLDLAQDAIAVEDMNNCVQYWNKSYERLTGWSAAEMAGQSILDMLKPDRDVFRHAGQALLQGGHWSGEFELKTKDGRSILVMSRWTLVRDEQGRPKSVLTINTDITEKKRLESQLLRIQRLEGIGALAGGIAHDLNNILSPVLMIAPLLRETVQDPDSCAMIDTITSCAQRGADIIKQLLTFARGTPGVHIPIPVRHLLHDMEKIIHETFPRNISPRVKISEDLWMPQGDATQLHQSLLNLCVNARDAMPEGGILSLEARNETVDEAFAARTPGSRSGHYVCVSVSDTGTGIAPENLDKIYDPFFTTKEIGKGTGLGLATVLGIVRGHEGFMRVNSRVGHGTTFELYFPASPEIQMAVLADRVVQPPCGQGELILVVDDEALVRDAIRRILEGQGYSVVIASQGEEGLEVFSRYRAEIRAVITDMMMPVMSGQKMVAALQAMEPRLLVLGMTGLSERKDVQSLENLHLSALLSKPFTGDELLQVLSTALHPVRQSTTTNAEQ